MQLLIFNFFYFIASASVEVFDMKNFIVIVSDCFREYSLVNNLENMKIRANGSRPFDNSALQN